MKREDDLRLLNGDRHSIEIDICLLSVTTPLCAKCSNTVSRIGDEDIHVLEMKREDDLRLLNGDRHSIEIDICCLSVATPLCAKCSNTVSRIGDGD